VIPTPALDRIAKAGLRYTQFCSTARARRAGGADTGRNHHSVGNGVISELSTGFPGYDSVIGADNATIAPFSRQRFTATSWFGKNHNTPPINTPSQVRSTMPSGMGFDYFYGSWRRDRPVDARICSGTTSRFFRGSASPRYNLTPTWRTRRSATEGVDAAAPRKTVLALFVPGGSIRRISRRRSGWRSSRASSTWGWNAMRDQIFPTKKRLGAVPTMPS